MAPSERSAMRLACSGVEMPKPMAQGTRVFSLTIATMEARSVLISLLTPVTPRLDTIYKKSFRFFCDPGDAVFGSRGDQRHQIHTVLTAERQEFFFFLKWQIRQNQSVDRSIFTPREEAFRAVGEHNIGVSHKDHGNVYLAAEIFHKGKDLIGCNAAGQRSQVCALDHGPLRGGIRERNAELNQIRAVFHGGADHERPLCCPRFEFFACPELCKKCGFPANRTPDFFIDLG